jgi:hypothetical protein
MVGHMMMYTGPGSWRLAITTLVVVIMASAVLGQQEAYFNGTQSEYIVVTIPPSTSIGQLYHLGFSFRTCGSPSTGTILSQVR